jgi:rare lipoprotein A
LETNKIIAKIIIALVLTNLISLTQNNDLFAKIRNVDPEFVQEGVASWYGPGFQGRKTANGERFNTSEMTAAHKTLPFNTLVKVTNLSNGVSTVVRINDRGPFIRGRIIDLSKAAKNELQMGGLAEVKIELYDPMEEEMEEETEEQENLSPINFFEDVFPSTSKIFVAWLKDSTGNGDITNEQLDQIFNSSKVKIKVLTADATDANSKIYLEISEDSTFNYFDVTSKIKFINGYTIEVASLDNKEKADELINKLESNNFKNIFLEEIISSNSTNFKIYTGNYKTLKETKEDIVKILDTDYKLKTKIVKIGQ